MSTFTMTTHQRETIHYGQLAKYRRRRTLTPPPDQPSTLGARLRAARTRKGLTLWQLAQPFFTKGYVSAVELGRIRPSVRALRHMAEKLGVSVEALTSETVEVPSSVGRDAPAERRRRIEASADREIDVYEALRDERDLSLAEYYITALSLLRGETPDPFATAAHEIRELMEKWNAPIRDEQRGLTERVDALAAAYQETRKASLAATSAGWSGEVDDRLRMFLRETEALFLWRGERHVPTRAAVTKLLRDVQSDVADTSLIPAIAAWLDIRNFFVAVAHHRRTTDREEFGTALEAFELLALRVLRPAKHTFTTMQTLEDVIAEAERTGVTRGHTRRVAVLLARRDIQTEHFFSKATAAWVKPLRAEGFFKAPPAAVRTTQGLMFPFWPESGYLARVASVAPELVTETFLDMDDTDNLHVHHDVIEAAMALPPKLAAKLARREAAWIRGQSHLFFLLPYEASKLVVKLVTDGQVKGALSLADALLDVLPSPDLAPDQIAQAFGPRPRTRSEEWEFGEALNLIRGPLTAAAGLAALDLFVAKLRRYLELWQGLHERFDYSDMWFDPVDGSRHERDAHALLASAVRQSADEIIRNDATHLGAVVERLERALWPVFHRIALHLLRVHGGSDPALVSRWIRDPKVHGMHSALREYRALVRERFNAVPPARQEEVVAAVVRVAEERLASDLGDAHVDPALLERERRRTLAFSLAPFSSWVSGEWKARWDAVANEYRTELEEPRRHAVWVGPVGPYTTEALAAIDDAALIEELRTWVPTDPVFGASREGLARTLEAAVAEAPTRYVALAPSFVDLDPAYGRALFAGLAAALRKDQVFPWGPVLELSERMYALPLEISGRSADAADFDEDPHRGWLRGAIARVLEAGLEARPGSLPLEERARIGRLLWSAVNDESPGALVADDGKRDWPTVAVNSPRGRAAFLLVEFAAWLSRELRQRGEVAIGLRAMPEFDGLAERLLTGGAPEAHAALGMDFTRLVAMDKAWAGTNAERIFPPDRPFLRSVAWEAYLLFSRPYDNVLPILRHLYASAVDALGAEPVTRSSPDPREHLAEHLLLYYLRGLIPLDGTLSLTSFYASASPELRKGAMHFLGRLLDDEGSVIPEPALGRLRTLIEWRLQVARSDPSVTEELAAFGWLFKAPNLDPTWSLRMATDVVQTAGEIEPVRFVIERMGALADEHTTEVLELLEMIGASRSMLGHVEPQTLERAIVPALRSAALRERAIDIANVLGQRGFVGLRSVVSGSELDDLGPELEAGYRRRAPLPRTVRTSQ